MVLIVLALWLESVWALVIGLATALWSATKAFVALQQAQDDIWEVHVDHRDAMPKRRGKALLGLLFIGAAQVGSVVITSLVNAAGLPEVGRVALLAATLTINIFVLAAMFRYLTAAEPTWRDVWRRSPPRCSSLAKVEWARSASPAACPWATPRFSGAGRDRPPRAGGVRHDNHAGPGTGTWPAGSRRQRPLSAGPGR